MLGLSMELTLILGSIFAFVLLKGWLEQRTRIHGERARLMQTALEQQHLDRTVLEQLAWQLTGRRPAAERSERWARRGRALLLGIGWLSLFGGAACWIVGEMTNTFDATMTGIILVFGGFAFTTFPLALREMEIRRSGSSDA